MSLYNLYRPQRFEDVVEQSFIIKILKNQIKEQKVHSLYLFLGSAGTGKTTSARIFANELNGIPDAYIEVDAASNNGVDKVRGIIEDSYKKPIGVPYKVYIIDEAHLLSAGAIGAFLKLLEEPPKNVVFLFCTTDPQKFPQTIFSRGQRFDFQKISFEGILSRLIHVLEKEGYVCE
jgi:DNA polymerase-3 subunit gamma/tau